MTEAEQKEMMGCTLSVLDSCLDDKSDREQLLWAMSILSDAQEAQAHNPKLTRQGINMAKYAIDKVRTKLPR